MTVTPCVRRSGDAVLEEDPRRNETEPIENNADHVSAEDVSVDVYASEEENVEGSSSNVASKVKPPRPANLKLHRPTMINVAGQGDPSSRSEDAVSAVNATPAVTLTHPTPERGDKGDEEEIFAAASAISSQPSRGKLRESMESSQSSVTNPRLLSSGDAAADAHGSTGNEQVGEVEVEDAASDAPPISPRYLETSAKDAISQGDVTSDEFSLDEVEEPEMTLARGGSALGGSGASFDEDLTLPSPHDGRHTPIRVSTGVKAAHQFEIPAASSPTCHVIVKAPSFDNLGISDCASPSSGAAPAMIV